MLQQIFHTLLVSVTCIIWGFPLLLIFKSNISKDSFWYSSFAGMLSFLFFSGCITISILSSWFMLIMPLKFIYLSAFTAPLLLFLLFVKGNEIREIFVETKKIKTNISTWAFIYVVVCIFLFIGLGSLNPSNYDTQIYHYQIIKWQAEYGTVPGIANLLPRFGQGSNWFNLISFFHLPFLKNNNFTYVNIAFVIWFFIWLLHKWNYHFQSANENLPNWLLAFFYFSLFLFCMFDWQLFRDASNSTNYDFEVTAFIIIVISFIFEKTISNEQQNKFSPLLILFALCVISFKFSGIFLILLVLYYLITNHKISRWGWTIVAGIAIISPVLIRNYITTGYPLFPLPICFDSSDWQLPKALAEGNYLYILNYNRFFNNWMFIGKIPNTPLNWIPYWFNGILLQHKFILFLAHSSVIFLFIKPGVSLNNKKLKHLIILLLLMIAGWFFSAPDPARFGYGFLLPAAFISLSLAVAKFFNPKLYIPVLIALTVIVCIYGFKKLNYLFQNPAYLAHPVTAEKPPFKTIKLKNININIPEKINGNWDHRCYSTDLPCLPGENIYIEPRGKTLRDGFRMNPEPDSIFIKSYQY